MPRRKINFDHFGFALTRTELKALDYIGRHRKSDVKPHRKSCRVSMRTANRLVLYHYCMWNDDSIMLTYRGERLFTALHPYSKWRIK